jgi:hypothetical protein
MGKASLKGINVLRKILENACAKHEASLQDLTVLSAAVDPYRLDTAAGHRDGAWLASQLNKRCGPSARIHWRGLHYAIVQETGIKKPNGEIYRNTEADWIWLSENAGKAARWLGYIPFERIIDQRNSEPIIYRKAKVRPETCLSIGLDIDIPDSEDIEPLPIAKGFIARQAYQFAIFGEKSSLTDIVAPIARHFEADLYLPQGEISDTQVYKIAKDANADGRPLVVFTLSDCDPAGHQMPISIGRKLQAFKDQFFRHLEFEVVPVALTAEQVDAENLPSAPMKDTEKRADRWREAFGIDQTEIDALTTPARRPILERMIRQAFKPYIDTTLERRVNDAKAEWNTAAEEAIEEQIDAEHLEQIREEASAKLEELRESIERINEQLNLAAGDHFELPVIDVPEPDIELAADRQALVLFEHDWVRASRALIKHKAYGK